MTDTDRLIDAFQQSFSFMAILDGPRHVFEFANDQFFQIIGRRDVLGKPVRDALPELEGQGLFELLDQVYRTGEPFVGRDMRVVLKREPTQPAEERYADFVYKANRTADGSISGILVHGVDVTQRKLAERTLARVAEHRRLALDSAQMGWWHFDLVTGEVRWDARFKAIFGVGEEALDYEKLIALIHPEDRDRVDQAVREATRPENPKPYTIEYRLIHDDGSLHWVVANGQAYFEGEGDARRAVSFVGTLADLTKTRETENALRESEAKFRQLADAMPQIVWAARPDGVLDYYNRRWFEYINLPEEAADDAVWDRYIHPDDLPRAYETWTAALRSGDSYAIEFRVRRADGAYRWFLVRALPTCGADGRINRWLGTCTDIHDQRQMQIEREVLLQREQDARAAAEAANLAKDTFLAQLSHELRTPLSPVVMTLAAMEVDPELPARLRDEVAMIRRNVELETKLIDDLLDLSRVTTGKLALRKEPTRVHDLLHHVLHNAKADASAKELEIIPDLCATNDLVNGDPVRLTQAYSNLIRNSIKFTPARGRITVRSRNEADGAIVVEVIDTGVGIPADVLPRIFDAFEQGNVDVTRQFGGLGLGLAISKAIVDTHDGTIGAASEGPGLGATFTIRLADVAPATTSPAPAAILPAVATRTDSRCRVLLVEDHADTAWALSKLLSACGYAVKTARSAASALELAAGDRFDVMISDLGLPDATGYDLMRQIHERYNIRGIALSGFGMEEDQHRSRQAGFADHVVKPVSVDQLDAVIQRVVRAVVR